MSHLVSLDMIKHRLAKRVDELVPMLYPAAMRDGPHWRIGSLSGERGQSLAINRTGRFQGLWTDFASGERGSMLDLVAAQLTGGDIGEAIRRARELTNLGTVTPEEARRAERRALQAQAQAAREEAERADRLHASAKHIFYAECQPLPGSPAERYLNGRAIRLAEMGGAPHALRFHPGLLHPETQRPHPALLALVMGVNGEVKGLHRTFLQVHADGGVTKLGGVNNAKLSLGPIKGGHIPIWRGASGQPQGKMPEGEAILLTEGIEDALSAAYECPHMRIWAGISLSNMGGVELPRACGGVFWHRHRDGPEATAAADRQMARLRHLSGLPIEPIWAPGGHKDFNDARKAADLVRFASSGAPGATMMNACAPRSDKELA